MEVRDNEILDDYSSKDSVVYEIRTLLNQIVGYTTIAKKNIGDDDKVYEAIEKIEASSNQLHRLFDNAIDNTQVDSGQVALDVVPVSITRTVEELRIMLQTEIESKHLGFYIKYVNLSDDFVYTDKHRIEQIAVNILNNAISHSNMNGKITMSVIQKPSLEVGYADYEFAFDIKDWDEEKLDVKLAKKLIQIMDGEIHFEVTSENEKRVIVRLHLRIQHGITAVSDEIKTLEGKKILLVEDNDMNQEIAKEILAEELMEVEVAQNGAIALEMLRARGAGYYDVILMDIQMPVMDGYETTIRIRRFPEKEIANIPIIAMTANGFDKDRKKALEVGMNNYIVKPLRITKLMSTIKEYI